METSLIATEFILTFSFPCWSCMCPVYSYVIEGMDQSSGQPKCSPSQHGTGTGNACVDPKECSAPKVPITTDRKFIDDCLKAQNSHRMKHGAVPLILNEDLGKIAQYLVNQMAVEGDCHKIKKSSCCYGGNVWVSKSPEVTGSEPVEAWYGESNEYDWGRMEKQKGTEHFTQMVWRGSKQVGIASAITPSNEVMVICLYYPPGNALRFDENVSNVKSAPHPHPS